MSYLLRKLGWWFVLTWHQLDCANAKFESFRTDDGAIAWCSGCGREWVRP